jgi:U3 small nucleolar RNA-associated protein 10
MRGKSTTGREQHIEYCTDNSQGLLHGQKQIGMCTFLLKVKPKIHTTNKMSTSLEKQLKFLKSTFPQSTAPKVKSGKESFLFSAEKAGKLSIEEIYAIGLNGTQQLCELDSRFNPFLNNLFLKKSTTRNRELQTKQENEELNAQLKKFLLLLGPYFLLKPAHMALEYLIRRYK